MRLSIQLTLPLISRLPVAYLPTTKPALVVRFNPIPFQLRTELALSTGETARMFQLPYRHIFAVATRSTVYLYDTQQPYPFAMISNLHYAAITDMAWYVLLLKVRLKFIFS